MAFLKRQRRRKTTEARSSNPLFGSADMAQSHKSKIRNSRPAWASAAHHNFCNHRRTGRRRSASSRSPGDRSADRSASIRAAAIRLQDFEQFRSDPWPRKIAVRFDRTPFTCSVPQNEKGASRRPCILQSCRLSLAAASCRPASACSRRTSPAANGCAVWRSAPARGAA